MFKKIICMIMAVATVAALAIPASATFTQSAQSEYLCTSQAGYCFNVDDYYNYMKRYNGMTYTTTSYNYLTADQKSYTFWNDSDGKILQKAINRQGKVFSGADYSTCYYWSCVKTYRCNYDANGTMKLSCTCDTGYCGSYWEGLTITASGDVSYTRAYNDGDGGWYNDDIHYFSLTDKWTYKTTNGYYSGLGNKITQYNYNSEYLNELDMISQYSIDCFASESMRECYWHYVPYVCYWQYI